MTFPFGQMFQEKYNMYMERAQRGGPQMDIPAIVTWCCWNVQYVFHPQDGIDAATKRILDEFLFGGTDHTKGLSFDFAYSGPQTFDRAGVYLQHMM